MTLTLRDVLFWGAGALFGMCYTAIRVRRDLRRLRR